MFFEQGSAYIFIERVSKVVVEVFESMLELFGRECILDSHLKQVNKPLEGILVHGVDSCKVNYTEKEQTRTVGDAPVPFSGFVDLFFRYLGILDTLIDFRGEFLAVLQLVDQSFIEQQLRHSSTALG